MKEYLSMYDIKWKNDLKMYIKTFNNFVFEGNVNDLQPVETNDGYKYLPLNEAIAELYGEDYCVVFYDHTKLSGKAIPDAKNDDEDNPSDTPPVYDESWFNSFVFYEGSKKIFASSGDKIDSPNIALFLEYYKEAYSKKIDESSTKNLQSDITKDMRRIYDAMSEFETKRAEDTYKEAKPFLFILPDVSRYMTTPGSPSEKENSILMILFNATQIMGTQCKLMLFVDKMNDLPTWFESENNNSAIKKIFLPSPDSKFRETFYRLEMRPIMQEMSDDELDSKIKKFSAFTENYSLRRLQQLRAFILNEEENRDETTPSLKKLENIDKTVFKFDVGQSFDPWRDKELRGTIKGLATSLREEVQGQSAAIARVTEALKAAATGVNSSKKNDRRPRAIFFFAGPTGVGKTELSKQIAEKIFQNQDSIIRFDMSEFREEHTDARLFGAPPGYVGYESGGELTKAIKQKPFSIVLFDEIEKAAPRIWDKFLQILGDGRLTDGKGETVSFTQAIIIFTSNLGITADVSEKQVSEKISTANTAEIDNQIKQLITQITTSFPDKKNTSTANVERSGEEQIASEQGEQDIVALVRSMKQLEKERVPLTGLTSDLRENFLFTQCYAELGVVDGKEYGDATEAFNAFVAECVRDRVAKYFEGIGRREVLGRIGEENILVFNFISPRIAEKIAESTIKKFCNNLKDENDSQLNLSLTSAAIDHVKSCVTKAEVLNFGGRGIVSCVEKLLSVPVGKFVFEHSDIGLTATMDYVDEELTIKLG